MIYSSAPNLKIAESLLSLLRTIWGLFSDSISLHPLTTFPSPPTRPLRLTAELLQPPALIPLTLERLQRVASSPAPHPLIPRLLPGHRQRSLAHQPRTPAPKPTNPQSQNVGTALAPRIAIASATTLLLDCGVMVML